MHVFKQSGWYLVDDVVMFKGRAVVPHSDVKLVHNIIECMHSEIDHIHPGQVQTIDIVKRLFWWPNMKQDIIDYISMCDVCQRAKYSNRTPGKMIPMGVPSGKWRTICMDFTDMPNVYGYNKLLIVVDKFSKMVKLIPLKERKTTTRAK